MKEIKLYVAPKAEVIEIEPQGVLCASVELETEFYGTGLEFQQKGGNW
jgi:hypothetical protein